MGFLYFGSIGVSWGNHLALSTILLTRALPESLPSFFFCFFFCFLGRSLEGGVAGSPPNAGSAGGAGAGSAAVASPISGGGVSEGDGTPDVGGVPLPFDPLTLFCLFLSERSRTIDTLVVLLFLGRFPVPVGGFSLTYWDFQVPRSFPLSWLWLLLLRLLDLS